MKSDATLPLFDTDIWWQKQLRLIRNWSLPSFLFVCHFLFLFFYYFCCSVGNEEARHEAKRKTSKRKRGRPSKNAEREREWTDEETFKLIYLWANHECLYNTKSAYLNKDKRRHALDKFSKTQRSHQEEVRCSWKSLDYEIIMEGKTTN